MTTHDKSGFRNCKECLSLLLMSDETLNGYWCENCKTSSITTKPIVYKNCPCGKDIKEVIKSL